MASDLYSMGYLGFYSFQKRVEFVWKLIYFLYFCINKIQ